VRVLVTGSSGFIGTHLTAALVAAGYDVHGLDTRAPASPPSWTHHQCDLLDGRALAAVVTALAPSVLVHLAARTDLGEKRHLSGYAANTDGVENLLRAVAATPAIDRCIITSTQLVCRVGYTPAHPLDFAPSTLYGTSKVRTERIWRDANGVDRTWCITRPTTIWGAGMNPHYLTFFRMLRDGRYFHVGDGAVRKAYGYVGNTVHQYLRLIGAPAGDVQGSTFYLSDYQPVRLDEWAECFRVALGGPPIRRIPRLVARTAALAGDALNAIGVSSFPFNSFRLNNVLTETIVPLENTSRVCGPLPYSMEAGVGETAAWLHGVLAPPRQDVAQQASQAGPGGGHEG
jgi:GlcNAc-P-P-Und epimerase